MFRRGDERTWVKLYNSLFIAMNEKKQVLTWHFTQSERFDFVKSVLERLKERKNVTFEMFLLDNCCKWERLIKDLFDENVVVKLDPFHAVQRITSTIRKKHPFHKQMCHDLQNLFRMSSDLSCRRLQETASRELILDRLDKIMSKWESLEYLLDGQSLITMETREAVSNLRKHINKGCLSGIPPGCSTSANENLHRYLNKFINGQIMGPELAEAVFTIFFNRWNLRKINRDSQISVDNLLDIERFGFGGSSKQALSSDEGNDRGKWVHSKSVNSTHKLSVRIATYRMLKSRYHCKYLIDIVSSSTINNILGLTHGNANLSTNASSFGFSISSTQSLSQVISTGIYDLLKNSNFTVVNRHLESKGFLPSHDHLEIEEILMASCCKDDLSKMAEFLSIPLVLFTDLTDIPVVPIFPNTCLFPHIWFYVGLANNEFYHCYQTEENQPPPPKKAKALCSCGKSSKDGNKISCSDAFAYKSRCPCLKSRSGCLNCHCKGCRNPFGQRSKDKAIVERKREPSQLKTSRNASSDYLSAVGEQAKKGQWSDVEMILLYQLLDTFGENVEFLLESFNFEAKELQKLSYQIDLKSLKELEAKVASVKHAREWFNGILDLIVT